MGVWLLSRTGRAILARGEGNGKREARGRVAKEKGRGESDSRMPDNGKVYLA